MANPAPPKPPGEAAAARRVAVLAGGAGNRMGRPKATLPFRSKPLLAHSIEASLAAGLEPFVVAKASSQLPALGCPLVIEPDHPRHPLVGIITALEHVAAPLVILACDVPFVPAALIADLADRNVPFAMPVTPRPQPLIARYTPALLPRLRTALHERRPLTETALELDGAHLDGDALRAFGDPERIFTNVNDPGQLERAAALPG